MSKEIVFNVGNEQTRIAIVEDGKLVELYIENAEHKRTIGNLYLGQIRKVMPSIQAAFVDIGQEQDAFLHFSDLSDNLPYLLDFLGLEAPTVEAIDVPKGKKDWDKRPSDLLNRGQTILVQVTKEPISNKGSRISTDISLAGRFLVLVPLQNYVAVSRKITDDEERRRLESLASSLVPDGVGVIVRTVAQDRDAKSLDKDMKLLMERWRRVEKRLKDKPSPPELVHEDVDMASSIVRDEFSEEYDRILVDHEGLYSSIQSYVRAVGPQLVDRVELHEGDQPVFESVGIQNGADRAFKDRVELPSGGYLFIEKTEAMHVVDVNSGRSGKGKSQAENSLNVNLEAARVIARQIRLRDLGGIIVVDFIDLRDEDDKKKVYDEVKKGFEEDRAVTKVLPMSDFGLVEITRQRLRPSITTTFSSANGTPSDDGDDGADPEELRQAERKIQSLEKEVEKREREVKRLKAEDDTPDEEVTALRQKIQALEDKLEAARAQQTAENATPRPSSSDGSAASAEGDAAPDELVEDIEQWLVAHSDTHRAVTLRVHPFVAAFLRRPVPTYATRWFMEHLVRVHVEADTEVPPHTFQVTDESGAPLPESP
ncbi:Rne/Rng family ribonuclease [Salinibacter ruber]|uniref:Ribonuclease G n=1 Tax=Salinibacter ruber TaxID=146919 RepID=A0A9X2PK48_9BACT|nr:Rne/Rng family ribonuclease [Salinibacter ruber]MCS3635008.1 ribonuclease G [Salinibacter ruber]MCS3638050.1 ribonuclease G [Salinibacter ruber]MCS3643185.1 ribonuclease G [Salinibacter ruber]MCS3665544.1 ribonuclease G [Salinibacter ruber]MCS3671136.1 ribonuclease G [Salinibacter ruber]